MDHTLLKILHIVGVIALFTSLGAVLLAGSGKKSASMLHGISLLVILGAGFALLGKPPMQKSWWLIKFGIWLFLGVAPVLVKRKILPPWLVLSLVLAAGATATWLVLVKPF